MKKVFGIGLVAAALLGAMGSTPVYADEDTDAIRALRAQSNQAIARHDVDAIQLFLDDDFVISVSTGAIERSRDEHIRSFGQYFDEYPDAVFVRSPSTVTRSDDYPLAIEQGTWVGTRTASNGSIETGGQYTAGWKLTDSGWKIYSELYVALYCLGEDC